MANFDVLCRCLTYYVKKHPGSFLANQEFFPLLNKLYKTLFCNISICKKNHLENFFLNRCPGKACYTHSLTLFFVICVYMRNVFHLIRIIRNSRLELFLGKCFLKICSKFTGKHPCRSATSTKLQIALWCRCSSVNLLHIF